MENLSYEKRAAAYTAVKERFNLKAKQRDMLDTTHLYHPIMHAAHEQDWDAVEKMLLEAEIIR